jgi:hypothetical protein
MSSNLWSNRRIFLASGARAFLVFICGSRFADTLLAQGGRKPPLRDADFNRRFSPLRGKSQFALEMGEAKTNLADYLAKHFELTPAQISGVKTFPAKDVRALNAALDRAVSEGLTLRLSGGERGQCSRIRPRFAGNVLTIEVSAT